LTVDRVIAGDVRNDIVCSRPFRCSGSQALTVK